jgi:hypothetical protein
MDSNSGQRKRGSLMKKTGSIVVACIAVALMVFGTLLVGGCAAQEEVKRPEAPATQPKLSSDIPLAQVLEETTAVLASTTVTSSTFDPFLVSLENLRPKPPATPEKAGGPVTATILYPPNLSLVDKAVPVRVGVQARDTVDKVDFYFDGKLVASVTQAPYEWTFDPATANKSRHTVKAVAVSGDYRDSDSITFYSVVKGSVLVLPWRPQGGNLPYQYYRNYYTPDQETVEAALFTCYGPSYYIDYRFKLPAGLSYLAGALNVEGKSLAWGLSGATTVTTGTISEPPIDFYFWDWSVNGFPAQNFFSLNGANFDNPYEIYTFENVAQVAGIEQPGIPFYGFNPDTKEVRLRIKGSGPVKFFLKPMELTYYAYYDYDVPRIRIRQARHSTGYSFVQFWVSEPVFYTVSAYDAAKKLVAVKRGAKPEGWVDVRVERSDVRYFKIVVKDGAGHTNATELIPAR